MATRADNLKRRIELENSKRKRSARVPKPSAQLRLKLAQASSAKGRSVHAATKSRADAKAVKPGGGKVSPSRKTGQNGGEEQTSNGVESGRGADGAPPTPARVSRKNTRGTWPAGEKRDAQLTRRTKRRVASPESRAARGK
jgi:hypothetical protein